MEISMGARGRFATRREDEYGSFGTWRPLGWGCFSLRSSKTTGQRWESNPDPVSRVLYPIQETERVGHSELNHNLKAVYFTLLYLQYDTISFLRLAFVYIEFIYFTS